MNQRDDPQMTHALHNLGNVYMDLDHPIDAEKYYCGSGYPPPGTRPGTSADLGLRERSREYVIRPRPLRRSDSIERGRARHPRTTLWYGQPAHRCVAL